MEYQHDPLLRLETVVKDLLAGFDALRAEAQAEGYLFVERLFTEWMSHTNRFDREGEALLAAQMNGVLAGIGGITIEPVVRGAVRNETLLHPPGIPPKSCGTSIGHGIAQSGGRRPADYGECGPREFLLLGVSRVSARSPRWPYTRPHKRLID
jgi:hypothetical protein